MQQFAWKFLTPVFAAGLALGALHGVARAEVSAAEQAMAFLSKSMAVDSKCNFLSSNDHDTLSSLVARAELSLAASASAPIASAALAKGRNLGKSAKCDGASRTETLDILKAAKTAAAKAPAPMTKPKTQMTKLEKIEKTTVAKSSKLLTYANLTQKYYLARRCGGMRSQAIIALYQNVVALHHLSLQTYGRDAVAAVMHRSEAQANATSCG